MTTSDHSIVPTERADVAQNGYLQCRVCDRKEPVTFTPGIGYGKHCGQTMYGPYPPPPKKCIHPGHRHDARPWWRTYGDHCEYGDETFGHSYDDDCDLCGTQYDAYLQAGADE